MMVLDSLALCSAMLERFDRGRACRRGRTRSARSSPASSGRLGGRVQRLDLPAGRPTGRRRAGPSARLRGVRPDRREAEPWRSTQRCSPRQSRPLGGRDEEAEQLSQIAEAAAADSEDVAAHEWRMAGHVLARNGSTADAERLARAAKLAATTLSLSRLDAAHARARAAARGRPAGARQAAQDALAVAERKGDLASSRRWPAPCSASCARCPGSHRLRRAGNGGGSQAAQPAR